MAYLFGSRARGTSQPNSDWDIAVQFEQRLSGLPALSRVAQLEVELQSLLKAPVDIVDLSQAHLTLLYECIWKGRCLFCPNEEQRIQAELEVRRRFEDYCEIQAFYSRALRDRVEQVS
jgi:predicted nucleotidyltransferase